MNHSRKVVHAFQARRYGSRPALYEDFERGEQIRFLRCENRHAFFVRASDAAETEIYVLHESAFDLRTTLSDSDSAEVRRPLNEGPRVAVS